MKKVWADRSLKIDPKKTFTAPEGWKDCNAVDTTGAPVPPVAPTDDREYGGGGEDYR
jgi:hypothetical protein